MDNEEALMESNLDETNPGVTNSNEILNIQIGDEDDINERENYSITISLKPCSYETSLNSIGLSNLTIFKISNPLILSSYKNFKRVVVDAYVYHKYCRSCCD
jgi:hypothetical protein